MGKVVLSEICPRKKVPIFLCCFQNNLKLQLIKIRVGCLVTCVSSQVENACLEVFAGKAYVW